MRSRYRQYFFVLRRDDAAFNVRTPFGRFYGPDNEWFATDREEIFSRYALGTATRRNERKRIHSPSILCVSPSESMSRISGIERSFVVSEVNSPYVAFFALGYESCGRGGGGGGGWGGRENTCL